MSERGAMELQKAENWLQLERELHWERLEMEERRWEAEDRRLERQLESQERIAEIQAEAQAKQFQAFMEMISMVQRAFPNASRPPKD